jgi:hypothetical protein
MELSTRAILRLGPALGLAVVCAALSYSSGGFKPFLSPGITYKAPFQADERLRYEVNWKPLFLLPAFKAGELEFRLDETTYDQKPVYRVKVDAISNGRLAAIARIDVRDYFETIFDRNTFRSYRLIKKTREGKRQRDFELVFDYQKDRLIARESDVSQNPPRELKNQTTQGIQEPMADIVSVFYIGRIRDLTPGDKLYTHLIDEGEARRVEVLVGKQESVRTGVGRFRAVKINTNGRIFSKGGNLRVWYSADDLRVPVRFEADVSFGKIYGHLIGMDAVGISRGTIKSN